MLGHGGSSAGSYLADPTSPHPLARCCHYPVSKCRSASIAVTGTVRVNPPPPPHPTPSVTGHSATGFGPIPYWCLFTQPINNYSRTADNWQPIVCLLLNNHIQHSLCIEWLQALFDFLKWILAKTSDISITVPLQGTFYFALDMFISRCSIFISSIDWLIFLLAINWQILCMTVFVNNFPLNPFPVCWAKLP